MQLSIPPSVTRAVGRQVLLTRQHSPGILFGAGLVGFVATTVAAVRATMKVDEIIQDHEDYVAKIQIARTEKAAFYTEEDYTEEDYKKDMTLLYIKSSVKLIRLYGPTVILGVTSIACLTRSHHILNERYAGMTAAYAALSKGFDQYRARVREELGEEKDREFRYGSEEKTIIEQKANGRVVKKQVKRVGPDGASIYARFFDPTNQHWSPEGDYNVMFLRQTMKFMSQKLASRGHLFLNEVYDALGMPRTKAGAVVGWLYETPGFDSYVDFGIFDDDPERALRLHSFVVGHEKEILLDFNVGGPIHDALGNGGFTWEQGARGLGA